LIVDALATAGIALVISGASKHRFGVELFRGEIEKLVNGEDIEIESEVFTRKEIENLRFTAGLEECQGYDDSMNFFVHTISRKK